MLARVSELETFRRWREDEEADLPGLLARLRGEEAPSAKMAAGTGFHYALEHAQDGEYAVLQAPGYVFHLDVDGELELPAIRELRDAITYAVDGGQITVSGQIDARHGRRVDDHKTTAQFDAESYFTGYQWRFYLEIHDADTFRWNVFEIREASATFLRLLPAELCEQPGQHYVVHGMHRLEQHRYPGMADDCARLAADFYRFARQHLPERFTALAA